MANASNGSSTLRRLPASAPKRLGIQKKQRSEMTEEEQLANPEGGIQEGSLLGFMDPGEMTDGQVLASSLPAFGAGKQTKPRTSTRGGVTETQGRKTADSINYAEMNKPNQTESRFKYVGKGHIQDPEMVDQAVEREKELERLKLLEKLKRPGWLR